jgi:hypothetical protein
MSTLPSPLQGINPQNPLGWPASTGTNMPSVNPTSAANPTSFLGGSPVQMPNIGATSGAGATQAGGALNPFGQGVRGGGDLTYNLAGQNLITGDWRNALIPYFTQLQGGAAGPAMQYYQQLMNLGSPYYGQTQRASWEQGVGQGQNAAAAARQRINAAGYGYAPSGLEAATAGTQATATAQNLTQLFLQNLFQNEQLQAQGAQGLAGLAQLFSPTTLTGQGTNPQIQQPTNEGAQWLNAAAQLLGAGSGGAQTGYNIATCWVAAELYNGWNSPETKAIRAWLEKTPKMQAFLRFYRAMGWRWAKLIQQDSTLRHHTKLLFDSFLEEATSGTSH